MYHAFIKPVFFGIHTYHERAVLDVSSGVTDEEAGVLTAPLASHMHRPSRNSYLIFWYMALLWFSVGCCFLYFSECFLVISGFSMDMNIRIHYHFSNFFWVLPAGTPPAKFSHPDSNFYSYTTRCKNANRIWTGTSLFVGVLWCDVLTYLPCSRPSFCIHSYIIFALIRILGSITLCHDKSSWCCWFFFKFGVKSWPPNKNCVNSWSLPHDACTDL